MQRFTQTVLARGSGLALSGAFVTIYLTGTVTKATLYSANSAIPANEIANPLTADDYGRIAAYIPDGIYDLRVDHNAFATYTIPEIQIYDLAELSAVASGALADPLEAIAVLSPTNGDLIKYTSGNTAVLLPITALAEQLLSDVTEADLRATIGLSVGTDVQAYSDLLADIAGLTVAQGDVLYVDGSGNITNLGAGTAGQFLRTQGPGANPQWSTTGIGTGDLLAANNLSDLANAATARTNLGLAIGTDVQAYDAGLADIAGLAVTDGNIIVGNGTNWVAESGATARASLGITDPPTEASASEIWTGTETAKYVSPDKLFDSAAPVTLTDAATIAVDMNTGINFNVTLGGNRTLGNPTNAKPGQSGRIRVTQDGTGSRTLAYEANWKHVGSAPTLATAAGAVDLFAYFVNDSTNIELSYLGTLA